ncbi:MAG: hypothetical protein BWK78_03120 [Thiotrichaceae bacterium IS1]|nr:MAG: hypothetical protein BWK78_03120 [Thiotrichaceae bacterium IS1]
MNIKTFFTQANSLFLGFFIIGIGILLRFFMLSHQSLWIDEGATVAMTDSISFWKNFSDFLEKDTGDRFQPLYYFVLPYWRLVFGDSEFVLRSFSALLGSVTVILIFSIALRLYGKPHALWTAMLASVSAFGIFYSQDARPYALLLCLATLQTYLISYTLQVDRNSNDRLWRWFFWMTTAIASFGSIFIIIFTVGISLSHFLVDRHLKRWLRWWLPCALWMLPAIIFYLSSNVATTPEKVNTTKRLGTLLYNVLFAPYGILVGLTYGPSTESLHSDNLLPVLLDYVPELLILLLVVCLLVFFLFTYFLGKTEDLQYRLVSRFFASLLIISFGLAFLFAAFTPLNWLPRHSFYLWIPFVLLIPTITHQKHFYFLTKTTILILILLNLYALLNYYFKPIYWKDNYRAVAEYLKANQNPSVASILLYGTLRTLTYYNDTKTFNGLMLIGQCSKDCNLSSVNAKPGRTCVTSCFAQKVNHLTQGVPTVLVVVNREFAWQKKTNIPVETLMSELYTLEASISSFQHFKIYRFTENR